MLFRHRTERRIDLYAENTHHLETKRKNCAEGWIGSDARFGPVLDIKVCKTIGRYSVEVQVPSLLKGQTTSWIRILNGVEKYVREAMPIQEEEIAQGRPAAKAEPTLNPASTSNPNFIPMKDRRWIDIEVQKSKDQSCFQKSKFITNLLRHKEVGVPCDRIVEKCKEILSEGSRYWSDEVRQKLNMAPHWSADKEIGVLSTGGGQKQKVSILFETRSSRKNPVLSSHSRSFRKSLFWKCSYQSCIATQCTVTKGFSPSTFITSERERNWDQQCVTVWYQEDSVLRQADMPYFLPWWTRWTMNRA